MKDEIDYTALYSRINLAVRLGIPAHYLYDACTKGEIPLPSVTIGRRLFYAPNELKSVVEWAKQKLAVRRATL